MFRHLAHLYDVNAVDANDSIVVSGSKDKMFKSHPSSQEPKGYTEMPAGPRSCEVVVGWVWQFSSLINKVTCQPSAEINLGDRVLCLSLSPCGSVCSIGTSGHYGVAPLHLFDMQCGSLLANLQGVLKFGAGTLDMSWDGPHTLLSAGYDTYIRLWDTRVGSIVLSWEDPHDSVLYCLQTDGGNTIMCGTSHHCRTQLWDKRVTRRGLANAPVVLIQTIEDGEVEVRILVGFS
uniref:Uncharacterized protein n=1 Tax=Timema genevievae TaxID=629358 RepID=A0A7R9PMB2_TIMGE|nr:unnamed protein product [Timema genevievae]